MKLALVSLFTAFVLTVPTLAHAQTAQPGDVPDEPTATTPAASPAAPAFTYRAPAPLVPEESTPVPATPPRYDYLRFGLGFRIGYIDDPGFDNFADSDVLAQASLDASYAFYTRGKLAISAGVGWDVGSRTSGARGF